MRSVNGSGRSARAMSDFKEANNMSKEKIINVPLPASVKDALDRRADANGRATIREAANIITKAVKKGVLK